MIDPHLLRWKGAALLFLLSAIPLAAQMPLRTFSIGKEAAEGDDRPLSNSAVAFLVKGDSLWAGGGKGIDLTRDGGRSWKHYADISPFHGEDISAIDGEGNLLWIALAGSYKTDQGYVPEGLGLAYSTDNGGSWTPVPQPREPDNATVDTLTYGVNRIRALAVTTTVNNITYDVAVSPNAVWIASFAAGLRRSTDLGKSWQRIILPPDYRDTMAPTDTLDFDLSPVDRPDYQLRQNLNHRVFSVMTVGDSTVWVGTAAGINKSTDLGTTWRHFTFANQPKPISGNFVVALGRNVIGGKEMIWAATVNALDSREFRGISVTSDGGDNWYTALRGEFCHNFGFKDSIAYAATSSGLYRSDDAGRSWAGYTEFSDPQTHTRISDPACYAVAAQRDTVWIATADGLVKGVDGTTAYLGSQWKILRAWQTLAAGAGTYVYPNPFSPAAGVCRVHYRMEGGSTVSIKIFNFAMEPVRTLVNKASRAGGGELDEIWDGKDDNGRVASNQLYYVRVQIDDRDPLWGKVILLQ